MARQEWGRISAQNKFSLKNINTNWLAKEYCEKIRGAEFNMYWRYEVGR